MALSPKTRLGTYEILGPLGAGGMGEVYRAKDLRLGREVAVKVLPAEVASSPGRLARFEREARTVAGLTRPPGAPNFATNSKASHRVRIAVCVSDDGLREGLTRLVRFAASKRSNEGWPARDRVASPALRSRSKWCGGTGQNLDSEIRPNRSK